MQKLNLDIITTFRSEPQ
uniref:Uncharacterized protein n=1 Tax=Arundo donax TaxID=35708 RepID=A0A0A9CDP7_ARUDO